MAVGHHGIGSAPMAVSCAVWCCGWLVAFCKIEIIEMQVDSALLGHPHVAEAVSFAAPDEKYGEVVAVAVVLTQPAGGDAEAIIADIRKFAATKLAKFKVGGIPPFSCHIQCVA